MTAAAEAAREPASGAAVPARVRDGRRRWGRGVRWRLALFYGVLVFGAGLVLLTATYVLLVHLPVADTVVRLSPSSWSGHGDRRRPSNPR